jgi:hypothetical protein
MIRARNTFSSTVDGEPSREAREIIVNTGGAMTVRSLGRKKAVLSWTAQLVAAGILLQTLFFKFSGSPESVHIFSALGVEPWGRIATGVAELAASVMLLVPRFAGLGGLAAAGIMTGAIASHLTVLGIDVQGDGGWLFTLAWIVFAAGALVAFLRRRAIPFVGPRLFGAD